MAHGFSSLVPFWTSRCPTGFAEHTLIIRKEKWGQFGAVQRPGYLLLSLTQVTSRMKPRGHEIPHLAPQRSVQMWLGPCLWPGSSMAFTTPTPPYIHMGGPCSDAVDHHVTSSPAPPLSHTYTQPWVSIMLLTLLNIWRSWDGSYGKHRKHQPPLRFTPPAPFPSLSPYPSPQ